MIEYKTAENENIKDIIELRLIYLKEYDSSITEEVIEKLKENMKKYLENHLNKDCFIELAYDGENIVSNVIVNIIEKVPSHRFINSRFADMHGVYTKKKYRNKGIATCLIGRTIEMLKNKDISYIKLGASNMGKSIYEKCGFKCSDNVEYIEMKYYYNKEN